MFFSMDVIDHFNRCGPGYWVPDGRDLQVQLYQEALQINLQQSPWQHQGKKSLPLDWMGEIK